MKTANIKKIELDANLLRAATPFSAKSDPRYYLHGIYLDSAGYITATNGHVMFRAPCLEAKELQESLIINIKGTIPAKATKGMMTLIEGEKIGLIEFYNPISAASHSTHEHRAFEIIDGKYPDVEKVIPTGDPIPTPFIGINPDYVSLVSKAEKALGNRYSNAIFKFRGKNTAIEVNIKNHDYNALVIIMPIRIEEDQPEQAA
ncbi:hypothetical protein [uncultured Amphritea sp.]|uniref:hypothetical protein n=1 Tax=uncultured Amphritea sp. TaxID=981605 RepID=UPI0026187788|nr:hypothetical protein [uncultured Amphritea sp.]